jgi:hypothetical protein
VLLTAHLIDSVCPLITMFTSNNKQSTRPIRSSMDRKKRPAVNAVALVAVILMVLMLAVTLVFYNVIAREEQLSTLETAATIGDISKIKELHQEFYTRYGASAAETILRKGVHLYGSREETAKRMVRAAAHQRPFVMAFAGYSVSVGRGNFFSQSFPFVVERILQKRMKQVIGVDLVVRNGAIGGIPSFPYGWCLEHFLGEDADVVSWDYSMNEGRQSSVLESYIRNALLLPRKPMFLMLDTNQQRCNVLDTYAKSGLLPDAIRVARASDALDFDPKTMENPPPGFQEWNEFGAPDGCPGRSSWHPKKKEHELIGWMIAMHMASAIELAHTMMQERGWQTKYGKDNVNAISFPPPIDSPPNNDDAVTQLLYGHKDKEWYQMKHISCRTSFLPAVDHNKVLPSVVVSGLAKTDLDMMEERPDNLYTKGWVLDVSKMERDTKKKVDQCGGLGYIDMKVALYGIPESGTLRLWLPASHEMRNDDIAAQHFDSLVICEANESRDKEACQLNEDIQFVVGGASVSSQDITHISGAGEYLKRKTCVNVKIPAAAKVTQLASVEPIDGGTLTKEDRIRLAGPGAADESAGLLVDITANPRVSRKQGACCISHIIWEH